MPSLYARTNDPCHVRFISAFVFKVLNHHNVLSCFISLCLVTRIFPPLPFSLPLTSPDCTSPRPFPSIPFRLPNTDRSLSTHLAQCQDPSQVPHPLYILVTPSSPAHPSIWGPLSCSLRFHIIHQLCTISRLIHAFQPTSLST